MASESARCLPELICRCLPLTRRRAISDPSPLSSLFHHGSQPVGVVSTQAAPTPSLPATRGLARVAQVEASPAITALKMVLGGLRDRLNELPPLQITVGMLLECVADLQLNEQNRQEYDDLALELANFATVLQKHVVESKPHDGPYSVANIVRCIDAQTQQIKAQQARSRISRLATAKDDEENILKCYRRIGALFQQLQVDILLSVWDDSKERDMDTRLTYLSPAYDAYYGAALPTSVTKRVRCTQGTRVELLGTAEEWACDENAPKIYWLNGMAGTGKTTIAYTFCEILQEAKQLGASFFCSRNSPDCRDINRIIPTIAYQLGRYSNPFRQALCDTLRNDPDASKRNIDTQFEHLIARPFAKMGRAMPKNVIVVIDALDECTDEAGTKDVLDMLIRHAANLPIKFFVASRPEPAIFETMTVRDGAPRSIFWLHDIEKSLVQADITVYLTAALGSIHVSPLEIEQLAARAGNLFIFAATAVRYILPDKGVVNRRERLLEVLALQPKRKNKSHQAVDDLYARILANALDEETYNDTELTMRRNVLWTVVCARESLTIAALGEMLCMVDEENIRVAIQPLQSLLHVSESFTGSVVSALHASFPDFLLSKERAGQFYRDEVIQSSYLAECCFGLMERSLKFNICGLGSSYTIDEDTPNLRCRADEAISTGLFYSCRYWSDHLTRGTSSPMLLSFFDMFLKQHLLFWMEALNLKGQIGHGEVVLSQVLAWLPVEDEWAEIREFTYDARNFLTSFAGNPTSLSTPHIYVSVLPFTSKQCRVWATYWKRARGLIEIEGTATGGRGKSPLATWVVGSGVQSIARSSDGRHVASGSNMNEVSVWDVSSGARVLGPLKSHNGSVHSVALSPDNSRIASGSRDGTICVWDAHNGNLLVGPLCSHTSGVTSVAFSSDCSHLASGSHDNTIRLWEVHTGASIGDAYGGHWNSVRSVVFSPKTEHLSSGSGDCMIRVWNWRTGLAALGLMGGHTGPVNSIAYSSDGLRLASGSEDCTVRVWDMSSGTLLAGPFKGHADNVGSVSFSPSGTQVVSASDDCTIRVWKAGSGDLIAGPFEGHGSWVRAVLLTTDGTRILSGSEDGTICVWDARPGTTDHVESLGHSGGIMSVVTSPGGSYIASGSDDKTVCVWDTHNGTLVAGPFEGHTDEVNSVAFSPDGKRIVSGSHDCTLRTWDALTGALLAGPFQGHSHSVNSVAFSPDGSRIASGSGDQTIRLWDSHTGKLVAKPFEGHTWSVESIAFSPDGARILSGSNDCTVRMWDANDGALLWTSGAHTNDITCVTFSLDGTRVASSSDNSILVLSAHDGALLHGPLIGHTSRVLSVAFSPDRMRLVSGSWDKTVRVWDVENGTVVIGPLRGHTQIVHSVGFSPNGALIISGSADKTIRFWDVAAAARPNATSLDGWSINDDGWLTDSQLRRLFWVPSDLRDGLWFPTPTNPVVSNARSITHIDNNTLLGERWHQCYDTSSDLVSS